MSFSTNEGSKQNTTDKGFPGGVDSTRHGAGSGAFDSGHSGLGVHSSQPQQRVSDDQTFRTSDNFDKSPEVGQSQPPKSSQRAFGDTRAAEKPAFSGSDSAYNSTETGGAFTRPSQTGLARNDELDDTPTPTSIPGTRSSGAATGGKYDNPTDDVSANVPRTQPSGATSGSRYDTTDDVRQRDQFPGPTGSRSHDEQLGGEPHKEHAGKPTFGDKLRGNVEKLAGTVSGKADLKDRGQDRKTGDY